MAPGVGDYNRVGREIIMRSIHLRGRVFLANTHDNAGDIIRYMIVYDRQPNGSLPVIGDILQNKDVLGGLASNVHSFKKFENQDRFIILLDKTYGNPLDSSASNTVNHVSALSTSWPGYFNHYIPLKNLMTKYIGDATTINSIGTGSLLFIHFGGNAVDQANMFIEYNTRLCYSDS